MSRGEPSENCAKVKEHGLTFPIVLQRQWEISRRYAKFATPVGYLIDERGIIARDAAVGVEPILALITTGKDPVYQPAAAKAAGFNWAAEPNPPPGSSVPFHSGRVAASGVSRHQFPAADFPEGMARIPFRDYKPTIAGSP